MTPRLEPARPTGQPPGACSHGVLPAETRPFGARHRRLRHPEHPELHRARPVRGQLARRASNSPHAARTGRRRHVQSVGVHRQLGQLPDCESSVGRAADLAAVRPRRGRDRLNPAIHRRGLDAHARRARHRARAGRRAGAILQRIQREQSWHGRLRRELRQSRPARSHADRGARGSLSRERGRERGRLRACNFVVGQRRPWPLARPRVPPIQSQRRRQLASHLPGHVARVATCTSCRTASLTTARAASATLPSTSVATALPSN